MGAAGFGRSFTPIVQYEKWEIHKVFPHFSYFRLGENLLPNLLAPLCDVALTVSQMSDNMTMVLRNQGVASNGRRFLPQQQGVSFFAPCPHRKGGDDVVTYSELFLFCTFIVSLISLIIEIILLTKKK